MLSTHMPAGSRFLRFNSIVFHASGSSTLESTHPPPSSTSQLTSTMADDKQKHLVFSILEFLQSSLNNGTIKEDDSEGIEGKCCRMDDPVAPVTKTLSPHLVMLLIVTSVLLHQINPNSCHSVHRRGLWCRHQRRCSGSDLQHQARHLGVDFRCLCERSEEAQGTP